MQLQPIRMHNGISSNSMARITISNIHKVTHNLSSNILNILPQLIIKQMLTLRIINIIQLPLHRNRKSDVKFNVRFRDKMPLLTSLHFLLSVFNSPNHTAPPQLSSHTVGNDTSIASAPWRQKVQQYKPLNGAGVPGECFGFILCYTIMKFSLIVIIKPQLLPPLPSQK